MLENRPPLAGKITPVNALDQPWISDDHFDRESDLLVFLKAYEYAKKVNFAKESCMSAGIHALRCREAEQIAIQTCRQVGLSNLTINFPSMMST